MSTEQANKRIADNRLIAEELMIGNWVYYGESIRQITAIHDAPQRKCIGVDGIITDIDVIKPVPITSEILEKAGFEWNANIFRWKHFSGWELIKTDTEFYNGLGDGTFIQPPIKYVHQLQNLYFALTGSSLSLSLSLCG